MVEVVAKWQSGKVAKGKSTLPLCHSATLPRDLGYRMPAEWERQEAVWLSWPFRKQDWPGKFAPVPWVFVEMIRAIVKSEKARVIVRDGKSKLEALDFLQRGGVALDNVEFYVMPLNRGWLRDVGPIYIKNAQGKAVTDWQFNGWAKYKNYKLDDAVPGRINELFKLPSFKAPAVLEGGAIDVNGKGLLIATEECLLSEVQQRNRHLSRDGYEKIFAEYLGVREVIWLKGGIVGDDTHGHVDDITRFVNVKTVATVVERNKKDENYSLLQENLRILKKTGLDIIELPMPKPVVFDGQRLPASYANFLITNGAVLVPVFGDAEDRNALNLLAEAFPKREIVPIYCKDLVWGLGAVHCLTQQEPA